MNASIAPGLVPPEPGVEKEEPELSHEDDIPADDGALRPPQASDDGRSDEHKEERPLRQVERE